MINSFDILMEPSLNNAKMGLEVNSKTFEEANLWRSDQESIVISVTESVKIRCKPAGDFINLTRVIIDIVYLNIFIIIIG